MRRRLYLIVIACMILWMAGCGKSTAEKVEQAQSAYMKLVERHNEVVNAYAEIEDETLGTRLDEMAEKINAIGSQDLKDFSGSEVDAIIKDLESNIASYDDILASIEELKSKEKEIQSLPLTLKNNTGIDFAQIYLYQPDSEDKGDNLASEMEYLAGYDTLNVADFYLTGDSDTWTLTAIDMDGNTIISENIELAKYAGVGITVQMNYNFDENKGWTETVE